MFRSTGPAYIAGISVLSRITRACARYGAMIYVTSINTESIPLLEETMETAYREEGKEDQFNSSEQLLVVTTHQASAAAFMMDLLATKQCAGNILVGSGTGSTFLVYETGARIGAMQLGAMPGTGGGVAMAAAVCDYVMFGTEIYGAGAIASGEPAQIGSLIGEDVVKMIVTMIGILGWLAVQFGSTYIKDLLSM
jgi:hypothetical protein